MLAPGQPSTSGRAALRSGQQPSGRGIVARIPSRISGGKVIIAKAIEASREEQHHTQARQQSNLSRRALLLRGGQLAACISVLESASGLLQPSPAAAFTAPPPGFRAYVDKLDGYSFVYPERWLPVTSSGNDCFLRNPLNIDENLFVDISSPSSSRYNSVNDLGTPEAAGKTLLEQLLNKEFMSTRLGIRREGSLLSATERAGENGRKYYDVAVRITSYASRNPYVATQAEVLKDYGIEWDRVLLTTLGVANKRLYELRLQTAVDTLDASRAQLDTISRSFTVKEVEQP